MGPNLHPLSLLGLLGVGGGWILTLTVEYGISEI